MTARIFAPAKVNLFLHVGRVAGDGFHPVCSLMVFADVGDSVGFAPSPDVTLALAGAFAAELADLEPTENLVVRAVRALLTRAGSAAGAALTLRKDLPVAAGLGGGSSDAGAALRLVRDALKLPVGDPALIELARELGADGPACLGARPVMARGRGDRLEPPPKLPILDAVLINPGVACSTGAVYRAYDASPSPEGVDGPEPPRGFPDAGALIEFVGCCRNDLEGAAAAVAPIVAETLAQVRRQPQTRLGRLSGSGATVFALCDDAAAAESLRSTLAAAQPAWWLRTCRLGGPWSAEDLVEPRPEARA